MSVWLRQSTASQKILLGKFVDSTDAVTAETALTIANTDIQLWKEGATTLANKNSGGATHISGGLYYAVLDAIDTDTLGKLEVNVAVSGALAVRREFMVLPAMVYDSLVLGTDTLQADAVQVLGDAQSATDLKDFADAGYDPATHKVQGVVLVDTTTTNTDMRGTDSAATAAALATAQADLDTLTGADGVTLATSQPNYAPAVAGDTMVAGSLGAQAKLDVNAEADTALTDYDPPTYTELLNLVRLALRKDAALATDLAALLTTVNADLGSGAGAYANTTDAAEAVRERGDAAWTTADVSALALETTAQSILTDTGTTIPGTITTLQATADALPTLAEILAGGDVDGYTLEQTLKLCLAALAGKLSGAATTTIAIRSADDTADRITATVDSDGNRTAVTLNAAG